jgi:hypothetical protein
MFCPNAISSILRLNCGWFGWQPFVTVIPSGPTQVSAEFLEQHPGSSWQCEAGYGAGHLVVLAAVPQGETCDKRQTLESSARHSKGGKHPQHPCNEHERKRALWAFRPAERFRRFQLSLTLRRFSPAPAGSTVHAFYLRCVSISGRSFHPAECFAGASSKQQDARGLSQPPFEGSRATAPEQASQSQTETPHNARVSPATNGASSQSIRRKHVEQR